MTNHINYFEKYMKYKTKYLELKNLIGGNNKNIIIIATHSYRLQCILNGLRVNSIDDKVVIKRFKNCAIVKIFCDTKGNTCVQIIFQGIYVGEVDTTDTTHFEEYDIGENKILLTIDTHKHPEYSLPQNTEIFFIRHGEGIHNTDKKNKH
jgi:hypothetical protein